MTTESESGTVSHDEAANCALGLGQPYAATLAAYISQNRERDAKLERFNRPGAAVAGEWNEGTNNMLAHRCEVHIAEEQEKPLPDTALIATLCNAARLTREQRRFPPIPHQGIADDLRASGAVASADLVELRGKLTALDAQRDALLAALVKARGTVNVACRRGQGAHHETLLGWVRDIDAAIKGAGANEPTVRAVAQPSLLRAAVTPPRVDITTDEGREKLVRGAAVARSLREPPTRAPTPPSDKRDGRIERLPAGLTGVTDVENRARLQDTGEADSAPTRGSEHDADRVRQSSGMDTGAGLPRGERTVPRPGAHVAAACHGASDQPGRADIESPTPPPDKRDGRIERRLRVALEKVVREALNRATARRLGIIAEEALAADDAEAKP